MLIDKCPVKDETNTKVQRNNYGWNLPEKKFREGSFGMLSLKWLQCFFSFKYLHRTPCSFSATKDFCQESARAISPWVSVLLSLLIICWTDGWMASHLYFACPHIVTDTKIEYGQPKACLGSFKQDLPKVPHRTRYGCQNPLAKTQCRSITHLNIKGMLCNESTSIS